MKLRQLYAETETPLSYFYKSVTGYYTKDWHCYRFLKLIQEEKGLLEPHLFDQFSLYLYVCKLLGPKFKMNSVQVRKQAGVCRFFFFSPN